VVKEFVNQATLLSSVLAGFALAGVLQLISLKNTGKTISWAIGTLAVATSILFASTGIGSVITIFTSEPIPFHLIERFSTVYYLEMLTFVLGVMLFLLGVALIGWIYSKRIGTIATVSAVIAFLLIAAAMLYLPLY